MKFEQFKMKSLDNKNINKEVDVKGLEKLVDNKKEIISEFEDLRGFDLSEKDLKSFSPEVLAIAEFDMRTKWPKAENLPKGFNPEKLLEKSKNPGLEIEELHKQGITGKGIKVAIIDQKLLNNHEEYKDNVVEYSEYGEAKNEEPSMHGAAVSSLLIGKTCGIAPEAKLVYKAVSSGRSFEDRAEALLDIIDNNRKVDKKDKVRVVSCSIGYMEKNLEPGLEKWIEAIKNAEKEGIIVVDVSGRLGVSFIGGGAEKNKDEVDEYNLWLRFKYESPDKDVKDMIIVPSDYRTMASWKGYNEYMYNGKGGMSWSVPYLAGIFALALQVNPELSKEKIAEVINKTALTNKKGLKIINPRGIIEAIQADLTK